jgi:hypothetical protein
MWDKVWNGRQVSDERVRSLLCELREVLRSSFGLPKEYDPIQQIDRGTWQLKDLSDQVS